MMTKKERRAILAQYTDGVPVKELASKYGVSEESMRETLREMGVILSSKRLDISYRTKIALAERQVSQLALKLREVEESRDMYKWKVGVLEHILTERNIKLPY